MGVVESYAGLVTARVFLGVAGSCTPLHHLLYHSTPSYTYTHQKQVFTPASHTTSANGTPATKLNTVRHYSSAPPASPVPSPVS